MIHDEKAGSRGLQSARSIRDLCRGHGQPSCKGHAVKSDRGPMKMTTTKERQENKETGKAKERGYSLSSS